MNYRKFRRVAIFSILLLSTAIAIYITYIAYRENKWETMSSAMAVITGVLAIWTSLNLTWRQEDEQQAQISLYIDETSHKYAYSLVIKNIGGSPAYKVKIEWQTPIIDYAGKAPRFTDFEEAYDFEYLPIQIPYSRFLMGSDKFRELTRKTDHPLCYNGTVSYSLSARGKSRVSQQFQISLEPFKLRLNVLNDQMDFYFENKKAATYLKSISESLKRLSQSAEGTSQANEE